MQDQTFGHLEREHDDRWQGRATFEEFRGYGAALDEAGGEDGPAANGRAKRLPPSKRQLEARAQLEAQFGKVLALLIRAVIGVLKWHATRRDKGREEQDEAEARALRDGTIELMIDATDGQSVPTAAQRDAWASLLARGDGVWVEVVEGATAVYNRQRPTRAWVWKATYGDAGLDRHLPELRAPTEMRRLVRPFAVRVKPADPSGVADVGIHFMCTWNADGFGALVRDGRVVQVGPIDLVYSIKPRPGEPLDHPVFGTLRRIPDDDPWEVINQWQAPTKPGQSGFDGVKRGGPWPWEGRTRCDPFLRYALNADDRAKFLHDPADADGPRSAMAWEFAEGEFDLRVYSGRDQVPSDAQAAAFAALRARGTDYARDIVDAIFKHYQEACPTIRQNWLDHHVDELVPVLTSPDGLRDRMQLRHVHVHPPDADGRVTIAFQFVCTWETDGFCVLWRDGRVAGWGKWKDAEPKEVG